MDTILMSACTKNYINRMLVARTRRERWKALKQFRIERREELKRSPYRVGLNQYVADVSAGIVKSPLTLDDLERIMREAGL